MSYSAKTPMTLEELYLEQKALGGEIVLRIPFDAKDDEIDGFISLINDAYPVLCICVKSPTEKTFVTNIVFDSKKRLRDLGTMLLAGSMLYINDEKEN